MPSKEGRTGKPGNNTAYKHIGIHTAKPSILQPSKGEKHDMSVSECFGHMAGGKGGKSGMMKGKKGY